MYAGKRPAYAAVSGKKKQAKQAGSAFAGAGNSAQKQDGAARFLTKSSAAAVVSGPLVVVFTCMALAAYWKQAPEISETAKRFVDVRQGVVGQPLSPPMLPTSVPSQKKYHVDEAVWASKVAWLMETSRANVTLSCPLHLCTRKVPPAACKESVASPARSRLCLSTPTPTHARGSHLPRVSRV